MSRLKHEKFLFNDPVGQGQVGQGFAQQVGTSPLYWLIGMQTVFSPTAWR